MLTDKLQFAQDKNYPHEEFGQSAKYNAHLHADDHVLSVAYGGACYGHGPDADQYEVALFDPDDQMVELGPHGDTVNGWTTAEQINRMVQVMQDTNVTDKVSHIQQICMNFLK
jgi:hypothetical protein